MVLLFQKKVLKKVYGPVRGNGGWGMVSGYYIVCKDPTISGHLERMTDERGPKRIMQGQLATHQDTPREG